MGRGWNPYGFQLHRMFRFVVLIFFFTIRESWCVNLEGLALLDFRANVDIDPYGIFMNWSADDSDPCMWSGVHCKDGKVQILDLSGLSLGGTLAPELGKLIYLKSLILHKNHFMGIIPNEFGELTRLELLDLSSNNLSGTIPAEIGRMLSLKRLLLCDNKFHGSLPFELGNLNMLSEIQFDRNLTFSVDSGIHCLHRKFGHCIWQKGLKHLKEDSIRIQIKRKFQHYVDGLPWFSRKRSLNACGDHYCENLPSSPEHYEVHNTEYLVDFVRRRLLEDASNLPALPVGGDLPPEPTTYIPAPRSSGSYPAIPKPKAMPTSPDPPENQSPPNPDVSFPLPPPPPSGKRHWTYIVGGIGAALFFAVALCLVFACRRKGVKPIRPWKSGLSGQLQKAFVTGVPKLNRSELESACEDFSNIIGTPGHMTVYKGTLSSGVEIAVASTSIKEYKEWSPRLEMTYRKKIDSLSRVNHKNFVNLLGFCEEDEPFTRMMVFEYAPSGSLFEHLHVEEVEHLDWNARMRIIMGVGYCLQHVHELNPPVAIDGLKSASVLLTDDNAAKVADMGFWAKLQPKSKTVSGELSKLNMSGELENSELPLNVDAETNVYCFGLLLLEIISGKLPYSEKDGPIVDWAFQYLNNNDYIANLIDPTLNTYREYELETVCEVIKECILQEPRQRPTMPEIVAKLRDAINISPEAATPRLSPLWWAELEILSAT
ncbi:hypothetical protein ACHQM5_018630 [Ranunculus cassubicifolius]